MQLNFGYSLQELSGLVESGDMTQQEARVVGLYYGLEDGKGHTEADIARIMSVTRQRVNVLRKVASERLQVMALARTQEPGNKEFEAALMEMYRLAPTLFWVPNIAQERACRVWEKEPYPFTQVLAFANGVGKTNFIAVDIAGTCLGPKWLNDCWYRDKAGCKVGHTGFRYYHEITPLRDSGNLRCRIVCDKEDMKENGSLYTEIKALIPSAIFKNKTSSGCYTMILIPHPDIPGVINSIDVKTFDQDVTAHSGSNLVRIWFNEPPRWEIYSENVGRTRSKEGEAQARVIIAATVVDTSQAWIWNIAEQEGSILQRASTWENCVGSQLTDEIVAKIEEKVGVQVHKDMTGNYVTRGVLTRGSIENQILTWKQSGEDEIRTWGQNVERQGQIYMTFRKEVHVRKECTILQNYPVVQIVDPHPVKPDASIWAVINPMNREIVFKEYPSEPYETLKNRTKDIDQTCEEWRTIERDLGIKEQVVMRIGDPNRFNTADSRDNRKLTQLYAANDFHFCLEVPDDLNMGHKEVMKLLYFNEELYKQDPMALHALPSLQILESCRNTWTALMKYGWNGNKNPMAAPSECVDQRFKDFADLVRYLAVMKLSFSYLSDRLNGFSRDYQRIVDGRNPELRTAGGYRRELTDYEKIQKARGESIPENYGPRYSKGRTPMKAMVF